MQLLKRILTAVVLIPIVLLLVLRAPVPVVALVAALVALLAVQELLKIVGSLQNQADFTGRPTFLSACFFCSWQ